MKSVQFAMRLPCQCRSMEVMDGKEMPAQQHKGRLWAGVRAGEGEALEYGSGISRIDREELLWLGSKWRWLKALRWSRVFMSQQEMSEENRIPFLFLFHHTSQEETEGKAMKSSEEVGKTFIFSKSWKQKLSDENRCVSPTCILNV